MKSLQCWKYGSSTETAFQISRLSRKSELLGWSPSQWYVSQNNTDMIKNKTSHEPSCFTFVRKRLQMFQLNKQALTVHELRRDIYIYIYFLSIFYCRSYRCDLYTCVKFGRYSLHAFIFMIRRHAPASSLSFQPFPPRLSMVISIFPLIFGDYHLRSERTHTTRVTENRRSVDQSET